MEAPTIERSNTMIDRIKSRAFGFKVSAITALVVILPAAEALAGRGNP